MVRRHELVNRARLIQEIGEYLMDGLANKIDIFLRDSDNEEIRRIHASSPELARRVKSPESIAAKAMDLGITTTDSIPGSIEDYIGFRIATPNKEQAKSLFEFFRRCWAEREAWLCDIIESPVFTPYTIEDGNKYSISTGYQAYHIRFIYNSGSLVKDRCDAGFWPVEIQMMSQLWTFWADYSRRYFYRSSDAQHLVPYQVAISRILDAADDLMKATADFLTREPDEVLTEYTQVTEEAERVAQWLNENNRLSTLFGTDTIPAPVFLLKIAQACKSYSCELDDIERFMSNSDYAARYHRLLEMSPGLTFLPPYQASLVYLIMGTGGSDEDAVETVNEELWLVGKKLRLLAEKENRYGQIMDFIMDRKFGIVKDEEDGETYLFFPNAFTSYASALELRERIGGRVMFDLELSQDRLVATRMNFIESE